MMKKLYSIICMMIPLALFNTLALAQTLHKTIASYHISPTFTYKSIQLFPQPDDIYPLGTDCDSATEAGTLYNYDNSTNKLMSIPFCQLNNQWSLLPGVWTQMGNDIFLTDTENPGNIRVGIGTNDPEWKLTLDGDGGIMAKGTEDPLLDPNSSAFSDIPAGDYAMFLWYPQKGALRAQRTAPASDSTFWNDSNVGYYSAAFGYDTIASGFGAFAGGENNTVIGPLSIIAGGKNNYLHTRTDPNTNYLHQLVNVSTIVGGEENRIIGGAAPTSPGPAGNLIGSGFKNYIINASESAIMGGEFNMIVDDLIDLVETPENMDSQQNRTHAFILGGVGSTIANSPGSVIAYGAGGGGSFSTGPQITTSTAAGIIHGKIASITASDHALIGSGNNTIHTSNFASIASGQNNTIDNSSHALILSGGSMTSTPAGNFIRNSPYSTIINGYNLSIISGEANVLINGAGKKGSPTIFGEHSFTIVHPLQITPVDPDDPELPEDLPTLNNFSVNLGVSLNNGQYSITRPTARLYSGDFSSAHGYSHSYGDFSWTGSGYSSTYNAGTRVFSWGAQPMTICLSDDTGPYCIGEDDSDLFIIANSGGFGWSSYDFHVGIGILEPEYALDVNGKIRTASLSIGMIGGHDTVEPTASLLLDDHPQGGKELSRRPPDPDLAEIFETTHPVLPGDVLVINPDNAHLLSKSNSAYASNAIGVVSSAPAMVFTGNGLITTPETSTQPTTHPAIALTGRVPVKVAMENGPIEPGDLLTTSSQPGTAMKATDIRRSEHAVIGKALQAFNSDSPNDTGVILAVIMLR